MRTYKTEINAKINEIYDQPVNETTYTLDQLKRWKKLSEELTQLLNLEIVVQSFEHLPKWNCDVCENGPCQIRSKHAPTICPSSSKVFTNFTQDTSAPF